MKAEAKKCDQRSDNLAGHGCADLQRSGLDECPEVSYEQGRQRLVDGPKISTKTKELLKEGHTKGTERWSNRAFFTHAKAGVGTRNGGHSAWLGEQELGPHEFEKMGSNEAVRSFFDGGVSTACDDKINNKVGSAYVIQIVEKLRMTHTR